VNNSSFAGVSCRTFRAAGKSRRERYFSPIRAAKYDTNEPPFDPYDVWGGE
jgi:hypothetical protein